MTGRTQGFEANKLLDMVGIVILPTLVCLDRMALSPPATDRTAVARFGVGFLPEKIPVGP
jgi:hypothetical protein